jgi:hypothetical protein
MHAYIRRFSSFKVSPLENHLKFDYSTERNNQNNERTSLLIECLLSLTLISGLNCVSLGMTRINKLWGGDRKTNQFLNIDKEDFIGGNHKQ